MMHESSDRVVAHLYAYKIANSAFHPSRVGKRVPASATKAKAGMVHSISGCRWVCR